MQSLSVAEEVQANSSLTRIKSKRVNMAARTALEIEYMIEVPKGGLINDHAANRDRESRTERS